LVVRLLLGLALATVAVAAVLYLFQRDARYLRFIGQVAKYTVVLLLAVLVFYALQRSLGLF